MVDESAPRDRDRVEGRYTEADGDGPAERAVHGQYTGSEGYRGPEDHIVGAYVGSQHDGEPPLVGSAHLRGEDYPRAER